jgi:hypothetical protein
MRRCLVVLVTVIAATLVGLPRASAGDAPIGHLGDTLRVDTGKYIADVTVSSGQPVDPPPGFDGVTPFGDAYKSRASDAPDALDAALANAPTGSIVRGGVYWEAYRDPVSTVVLLDKKTGYHLAQWNL